MISAVMFAMILLTMFSRNYLGVHTPQDVIVGLAVTSLMLALGYFIEEWTDKNPDKRDLIVLFTGIIICIAFSLYYFLKPYPMEYLAGGKLLVDPKKMIPDSFEGIGAVLTFSICRYFERRGFDFETELNCKDRFIIGTIALIPAMWWNSHIVSIFTGLNLRIVGKTLWLTGIIVYATIIVPLIMKKVKEMNLLKSGQDDLH